MIAIQLNRSLRVLFRTPNFDPLGVWKWYRKFKLGRDTWLVIARPVRGRG